MKNNLITKAFDFATLKHKNQTRKGINIPYITHIYDVAKILTYNNANQTEIVAGILHDTLEDTDTTETEILKHFGKDVLEIVKGETENKALPYKERKQEMIDALKNSSKSVKLVKCADMLANISDTKQSLQLDKEQAWKCFNAPKETIGWYYKSMIENMTGIHEYNMYKKLKKLVFEIF